MDQTAMFQLSYGLYVLTGKEGEKDNGCIINTAAQVTSSPNRITVAVNKQNLTHDIIRSTGLLNLSILDETAPFEIFRNFGFQSGRNCDKFKDVTVKRSENGLIYLIEHTAACISGKILQEVDLGSHTLFAADVTDALMLSGQPPVTYSYYQANIKPKPEKAEGKGYRCRICGYVYEGETLPEDFICPLCSHGAGDFEKIS